MVETSRRSILVTGGAGFLGAALCERLLDDGHDVICVDNFFTGRRRNVEHLLDHPRFELLRHDVTFPLYVEVDEIYNFACPASPIHYQHDPVSTTKTSVHGAINMLGLAKRVKAKILQASTSEVYGDPTAHPQLEQYWGHVNCIGPRACYDEGKRCAETLFFDYHRQHALRIKVARIFNTYGPGMHPNDGRVVSNFIVQALKGQAITVYGNGEQTRSFCYRDDLIDGCIKLMQTPDAFVGPVNMGNPRESTIAELAELIIRLTGSSSQIVVKPLPVDDPLQRCPDISLARQVLNWQPTVSLEEGLRRTIAYFDALLREEATPQPAIKRRVSPGGPDRATAKRTIDSDLARPDPRASQPTPQGEQSPSM
ncbi:MAG: UDP-glucuronic acid decarboxylase family protein [Acidobacteriota bacterium]